MSNTAFPYVILLLATAAIVRIYMRNRSPHSIPIVPILLPWLGNAIEFRRDPTKFLEKCHLRYGPTYKILLAGRRITILSTSDTIGSFVRDSSRSLDLGSAHYQVFQAITGLQNNFPYIYKLMRRQLFPIIASSLSKNSLQSLSPQLSFDMLSQMTQFTSQGSEKMIVSLYDFVGKTLYNSVSLTLFGPLFPLDTYPDFCLVGENVSRSLLGSFFTDHRAERARERLLSKLSHYTETGWQGVSDKHQEGASKLISGILRVIKDSDLSKTEETALFLDFMWGLHTNTLRVAFWLLVFVLSDVDSFEQLRQGVQTAVDTYGLTTVIQQVAPTSEGPILPLLDSAIQETMRLIMLTNALREATQDIVLRGEDGAPYFIRRGEFVMGNIRAMNLEEGTYPDARVYKIDRFVKGGLKTSIGPWGGGAHICKGRHFAQYTLKTFIITCFHLYDISIVPNPKRDRLPTAAPDSVGVIRTDEDVSIRLRRRHVHVQ